MTTFRALTDTLTGRHVFVGADIRHGPQTRLGGVSAKKIYRWYSCSTMPNPSGRLVPSVSHGCSCSIDRTTFTGQLCDDQTAPGTPTQAETWQRLRPWFPMELDGLWPFLARALGLPENASSAGYEWRANPGLRLLRPRKTPPAPQLPRYSWAILGRSTTASIGRTAGLRSGLRNYDGSAHPFLSHTFQMGLASGDGQWSEGYTMGGWTERG